ncbi:MAG TPA: hypothetical protein VN605_06715 [Thermoanaerobaculia bacterium]|nr:hypothetical protein [Thermoanaerobaculia bacterium]
MNVDRHRYSGDLDAPPPDPRNVFVEAPRFRPKHAGRSVDELYADIRIACRHCGLKVLDGHHSGWDAHRFEPYPINPKSIQENVT